MDDQTKEIWSEEPSAETGDFVHINLRQQPIASVVPVRIQGNLSASKTKSFPVKLPDWSNLEIIHRNTLSPRASFFVYDSVEDALTRNVSKSKALCLSGTWKFNLSKSPFEAPPDFFDPSYNTTKWSDINVPGMWQLQGHGRGPQYTNVNYPFPVDPGKVPYGVNECGCHVRKFRVPNNFNMHQLRLRFEGVDSAFHVWVNGSEIGYSQGSRNPSEFDVTKFVNQDEENTLAVQVYQYSDGSYIEDQDQWWLSGIFRDVYLLAFPKIHIEDFQIQTHLDKAYKNAILSIKVDVNVKTPVVVRFTDHKGTPVIPILAATADPIHTFSIPIKNPHKWTAETPYLYQLTLSVGDSCTVEQQVGFRNSELRNGVFLVNGKPTIFRGVNRHEHHPDSGRAVPYEFLKKDLLLMKAHNINAIRTSHYINDTRLYDLADELGFWVLDECDLECHGFGEIGGDPASWVSDNPLWEKAYVDRARQAVMRDKNHPSVIMWSLGNEAFYGRNHQAMYDFIKAYDPTRLVHYEADQEAQTVDIFSRMYTSCENIIKFAKAETWDKPLVMCEYGHAMGNGPGALKEYVEAFYKYPRLMGGFIWEWANHGLTTKTLNGEKYYGYGGDFGDEPNDGHFVMDGLCFSDHRPTPGLTEYRKAIEPVQVISGDNETITVINRYDHVTLDHLVCYWELITDGHREPGKMVEIPKGIKPGRKAVLKIEGLHTKSIPPTECYLELVFRLKESTRWAKAHHEVADGQIQLVAPRSLELIKQMPAPDFRPKLNQISSHILQIAGSETTWRFNVLHGTLVSWQNNSTELIHTPPVLDFYRAVTDNDAPSRFGQDWIGNRLNQTQCHIKNVTWSETPEQVTIEVTSRIAPPVLEWSVDTTFVYTFTANQLSIKVKGTPRGNFLPKTFARIGLTLSLNNIGTASWFGRGPGESYRDKKLSQRFGNYSLAIDKLFVDYEFPQETSNRTDVRWVAFSPPPAETHNKPALKAHFGDLKEASFTAMHYRTADLDKATHPYELHKLKRRETVVRLDWAHHGLGTGSCGPATLPEYELRSEPFEYEVLLE